MLEKAMPSLLRGSITVYAYISVHAGSTNEGKEVENSRILFFTPKAAQAVSEINYATYT